MDFWSMILAAIVGLGSAGGYYERRFITSSYNRATVNGVYRQEFPVSWTGFDNYEWPSLENNTERNYGIFSVTEDGKHLKLKDGSRPLQEFALELENILKNMHENDTTTNENNNDNEMILGVPDGKREENKLN